MNFYVGQLQIKKRSLPQWLSLGIFVLPFFFSFLIEFLKVPSFIKYTVDMMWVSLLLFMFVGKHIRIKKNTIPLFLLVVFWLFYVTLGYILNYQSVFYFLWGIRNNLRFFVAFFAFATFLEESDIAFSLRLVDVLFWINIPVTLFQFFVWGYQQDYLGGIFGVERGCNAFTSVFFALVVARSLLMFFEGEESTGMCMLKSGVSLILAAMAELKFYIVLFLLMVLVTMLMTKFSWRKFIILVIFGILISMAGTVLTVLFGMQQGLSWQKLFELVTAENYATGEDLGRLTALPKIAETFLTQWYEKCFGMGLGNCDTSAFAICNTPFFQQYEYLHYTWFSSAFLFLETGYLGLTLQLLFYVVAMILIARQLKYRQSNALYCKMAIVFALVCLILTFYNSALRKEVGYIAYFALALPFACSKEA